MLTTDWMKVATAGRTLDGREIKAEWLEKMAASYSPQVYTASVNSEHVFFPGLGHVTELRAGQDAQGRLALYAKIAPTAELLGRFQNRKQVFFSVEIRNDFPAKGDYYLSGLAVTDIPASQGLEPALFSAGAQGRQRFFDTAHLDDNGRDMESQAEARIEDEPPHDADSTPPGWWTSLWSALRPHFITAHRNTPQEHEPMTPQEREEFNALKATVEKLGQKMTAQATTETEAKPPELKSPDALMERFTAEVEARVKEGITAALKPLAERLTALEHYMDAPVEGERGEVTGPVDNAGFVF
ncbi:MAG: GPO family capsid scaffolding protein [Nitrospira sp.]|nr:GPO family capsid scaffolding protein [Nitrospira sp.]